jgi:aquaporin Z
LTFSPIKARAFWSFSGCSTTEDGTPFLGPVWSDGKTAPCAVDQIMRTALAEFVGTFALVFAGTGAIIVNEVSGGQITHVGVALTFGLIVLAMIYTLGDVSGAHLNPAITLGFFLAGRFPARSVPIYIGVQILGAVFASTLLKVLFPAHQTLGATIPSGSAAQSFIFEILLTFILMLAILKVSTGAKEKDITAGIVVGSVITLEAMFAGPMCGASMNPARSLAPAFLSGNLTNIWIYLIAPPLGACLAIPLCCGLQPTDCCSLRLFRTQ